MSQIILDISGNTHKNDTVLISEMIDAVEEIDTKKHEIVFKGQLFKNCPPNIKTTNYAFAYMMSWAILRGYQCTASIFDTSSLKELLCYKGLPFIKIPCRPELYWLIGEIPRKHMIYCSKSSEDSIYWDCFEGSINFETLWCIPEYPAGIRDYEKILGKYYEGVVYQISDHTIGLDLYHKYQPRIWEKHYILKHDKDNPDGGEFAVTQKELASIL